MITRSQGPNSSRICGSWRQFMERIVFLDYGLITDALLSSLQPSRAIPIPYKCIRSYISVLHALSWNYYHLVGMISLFRQITKGCTIFWFKLRLRKAYELGQFPIYVAHCACTRQKEVSGWCFVLKATSAHYCHNLSQRHMWNCAQVWIFLQSSQQSRGTYRCKLARFLW